MSRAQKSVPAKMRSGPTNRRKYLVSLGWAITLGLLTSTSAVAQALDGAEIKELALGGTWAAEETDMGYWNWSEDDTVCLRVFGAEGDCADTGTWSIDGDVMCYELKWWGQGDGYRINCFTVVALGDDRYEALYHGGAMVSTFIHFAVLE